jgi:ABC-type bacteriocin/lantibiotic exporter with double-glycine peptidase domain
MGAFLPSTLCVGLAALCIGQREPYDLGPTHKVDLHAYRDCGPNSLYLACRIMRHEISLAELKERLHSEGSKECSLLDLQQAATQVGLHPVGIRTSLPALQMIRAPTILHLKSVVGQVEGDHFLLYLGHQTQGMYVLDAPAPAQFVPTERLNLLWTGNALVLCQTPTEVEEVRAVIEQASAPPWWKQHALWLAWSLLAIGTWIPALVWPLKRKPNA